MNQNNNRWRVFLVGALFVGVIGATFWPVFHNDFINYDDPDYVTANEVIQNGLTLEGVEWAVTTGHASNWHPVTWLSHMLDISLFDLRPMGHHATNLFFHVTNSLLLLLLLRQMTNSLWRSALVAALFALHPLHVESVAWVAERKDVLSAFFGILTLMAYVRFAKFKIQNSKPNNGRKVWYGLALVLYTLGLMSKPMLVTWPFVMLVLDFWPLNRISFAARVLSRESWHAWKRLLPEKLPFFALAIISCVVTVVVQSDAVAKTEFVPISDRLGNAVLAYAAYLGQTVWPTRLAVFYPFPLELSAQQIIAATAVLLAISVTTLRLTRTQPFAIAGWLWYLGMLVPVIGLVQVGSQARADRYTYLPLIGIFIIMAWGLGAVVQAHSRLKRFALIGSVLMLVALSVMTHRQAKLWRNSRTLFAHAAQVTRGNYVALSGVGIADALQGDWAGATTNLTQALEFARHHHAERLINYYIGVMLQMQGKGLEALPYLEDAVVSGSLRPERNYRLGLSLLEANRLSEAETALQEALAAKPQSMEFQLGKAALFVRQGDLAKAEPAFLSALTNHPDSPIAHKSFGDFLALAGRFAEAEPHYAKAVQLKPADAVFRRAYATTLRTLGKPSEAIAQLEEATTLGLVNSETTAELAELYDVLGQSAKAVDSYEKAIAADPKSVSALNNLAWILATDPDDEVRNGSRAVELAERACKMTEWKAGVLMGTLAAAYAEAGRFPDAVAMAGRAGDRARMDQQETIANKNDELRKLYEHGKPFRNR